MNEHSERVGTAFAPQTLTPEVMGLTFSRYALVLVLLWIGGMKFTAYEAQGIQPFIQNSPFFSWMNRLMDAQTVSITIGCAELLAALLVVLAPAAPRAGVVGGALCVTMFLGTLSFMLTTPGTFEPTLGFPALSVVPGQFLVKDTVLLGVSLTVLGASLRQLRNS